MKMVITDIQGNTAVGLRDDGSFVRLRQCGYAVGQTVEIKRPAPIVRLAAACAAAFILVGGSAVAAVRLPYSYVTLDINPSVKFTLNIFNRVLAVSAVNEDARAIVDAIEEDSPIYARLDDAIEMTIAQCETEGYINQDDESGKDYVVLSVTSRSHGKATSLSRQLDSNNYSEGNISAKVVTTTIPRLREAEQLGTTPGKLTIIGEMQEKTGDTHTPDHWINVPVRDIIRETERGKQGKWSTGETKKDVKSEEHPEDAAVKGNPDKPGNGQSNAGKSKTKGGTENTAEAQRPFAGDKSNPTPNNPLQGQTPRKETDAEGNIRSDEEATDASSFKQIQLAIDALNEADRELLSSYIEAYETAVAEETAAENMQETNDLSSYRDAVEQALFALCEAAEDNGIALGSSVRDSEGRRQNGGNGQKRVGEEASCS